MRKYSRRPIFRTRTGLPNCPNNQAVRKNDFSRNIKFPRTLRFVLATFHFLDVNIKFPCNFCLILVTFHVFVDLVDHGRYRAVSAPSLVHTAKMKLAPFGTVWRQCLAHEARFNNYRQKTQTLPQTAQERQTADLLAVALEKRNTRTDRRRPCWL